MTYDARFNHLQVFCHLASEHLAELNRWTEDAPIIQIGGGGFNGFSQSDFLTRYERNWELEKKEKDKEKKKSILKKKVNFCGENCINYCDTRAFFLTPLKKKKDIDHAKMDFKSLCKVL
jgi:hypothetical protein